MSEPAHDRGGDLELLAPPPRQAPLLWAVPAFVFLALAYWSLNAFFPYYFIWDLDHIVALDTLIINSGLLPDHIHSPGFGTYLITVWVSRLASGLDMLSALNLAQLDHSLNPLACLGQAVELLRRLSPLAVLGAVFLLWGALQAAFRPRALWALGAALVLGLEQGLFYQAALIRTEQYSLLYWAGAALLAVLAGRGRGWPRLLWLGLCGLLLGLAFVTKVQLGTYLLAAPLLFLLPIALRSEPWKRALPQLGRTQALAGLAAAVLALAVTATLAWLAWREPIPEGMGTFLYRLSIHLTPPLLALLAFLVVLVLVNLWGLFSSEKRWGLLFPLAAYASLLLLGFGLSFFCHFLIGLEPALAWQYLLLNFKMAFLRQGFMLVPLAEHLKLLAYLWPSVLANLVSLALLAWCARRRLNPTLSRTFWLALALALLAYAHPLVLDRFILRDLMWAEPLMNLTTLICLLTLARCAWPSRVWGGALGLVALLVLVSGALAAWQMPARLNANYNLYGWSPAPFMKGVYGHNQPRWEKIARSHYGPALEQAAWGPAGAQAAQANQVAATVGYVLPTLGPNLRRAGVVAQGAPVSLARPGVVLGEAPCSLAGGILVDFAGAGLNPARQLKAKEVLRASEELDKFAAPGNPALLAVLPRPDLRVFLFAPDSRRQVARALSQAGLADRPSQRLTVSGPGVQSQPYDGYALEEYCELPLGLLGKDCFLVITSRLGRQGDCQR
ncbi:MAG: hypothetical protein K9K65_11520 [Desulfarculaceae bacterium]|nr:hypothetical protein [Desulfarculaceae bacterium]MCF8046016.1 hypothetical protein [Desulfarculaceae bacterium]MCF8064187.1 hypothetical protein [Desulfarculaceae bacterium]MCF8098463.1 hypothetical protein [Desulfarculaceae bacterium]MCF8123060.1 hypothetical protein [Desulfarculaceae bacterium]